MITPGRNASPKVLFVHALFKGKDADAVRLLEGAPRGLLPAGALVGDGNGFASDGYGWFEDMPVLFFAIFMKCKRVVRTLVRSGADLNALVSCTLNPGLPGELDGEFNATGIAIAFQNADMLEFVHSLGASLDSVYLLKGPEQDAAKLQLQKIGMSLAHCVRELACTAVRFALSIVGAPCLKYLLETSGKPIVVDNGTVIVIANLAVHGGPALEVYQLLHRNDPDCQA